MRTDNLQKVAAALITGAAMSARVIAQHTGLSYNTVKSALIKLEAEEVPDSYPTEWKMTNAVLDRAVSTEPKLGSSDLRLSIPLREESDWPQRWEIARQPLSKALGHLTISAETDPKELVMTLQVAATNLASIAYAVSQVQYKPDWFTLIGGDIDPKPIEQ